MVRSPLVWLGYADPYLSRDDINAKDEEAKSIDVFLSRGTNSLNPKKENKRSYKIRYRQQVCKRGSTL